MAAKKETMTVYYIDDQGDRVLLYGLGKTFYIIAKAGCTVKRGDTIQYEPYGVNFGWHIPAEPDHDTHIAEQERAHNKALDQQYQDRAERNPDTGHLWGENHDGTMNLDSDHNNSQAANAPIGKKLTLAEAHEAAVYPLIWRNEEGDTYTVIGITHTRWTGYELHLVESLKDHEPESFYATVSDDEELYQALTEFETDFLRLLLDYPLAAMLEEHLKPESAAAFAMFKGQGLIELGVIDDRFHVTNKGRAALDLEADPHID